MLVAYKAAALTAQFCYTSPCFLLPPTVASFTLLDSHCALPPGLRVTGQPPAAGCSLGLNALLSPRGLVICCLSSRAQLSYCFFRKTPFSTHLSN